MNYEVRKMYVVDTLGMPIKIFEVLEAGKVIAETRTIEHAELLVTALRDQRSNQERIDHEQSL